MSTITPISLEESGEAGPHSHSIPTAPCSQQQEAFWALDRLQSNPSALNIAVRWKLEGAVVPDLVERAFQQIVSRHEVLRTGFVDAGGIPQQRIFPSIPFRLAVVDLSLRSEPGRSEKCEEIAANEARHVFNLAEPPLLRVTLVQLDERTSMLLVTAHHTICDGWSVGILSREFGLIYDALHRDISPALAPLPIQYADFALWQRECLEQGDWSAPRDYWTRKLAGVKRFELPAERAIEVTSNPSAAIVSVLLARDLTDRLQSLAKTQRCSFFALSLATLVTLLHRLSAETDITIGTQIAGRDQVELEELIGVFINTLPLRIDLSDHPSLRDVVDRAQDTISQALIHQLIPAEELARLLKPKPELGAKPPLSVNFIFQRSFIRNEQHSGFRLIDMPSLSPGALYDLNFFMVERPEGWRASCEFNGPLYERATIECLLDSFRTLLSEAATNLNRYISDFPLSAANAHAARALQAPAGLDHDTAAPGLLAGIGPQPATEAEAVLANIWCDLLNIAQIGGEANFFELGGHSLLAARMLARVEEHFGKRLSLATLIDAPTLRGFAARLEVPAASAFTLDVRHLRREGADTPILAINYSILFGPLATRLGPDHPFMTVQLPGFDGREHRPFPPFDDIVEAFVEAFSREHPTGPLAILGFCGSAPIAYEVARRMRQRERDVALLVLIGAWAPGYVAALNRRQAVLAELAYRIGKHRIFLGKLFTGRLGLKDYFYGLGMVQNLRIRIARWRYQHRFSAEMPLQALDRAYPPYLRRITGGFQPTAYDGPMLVLRATEEPMSRYLDSSGGWCALARGPIEVRQVSGDHLSIFEGEGVEGMATYIRACLQEAGTIRARERI